MYGHIPKPPHLGNSNPGQNPSIHPLGTCTRGESRSENQRLVSLELPGHSWELPENSWQFSSKFPALFLRSLITTSPCSSNLQLSFPFPTPMSIYLNPHLCTPPARRGELCLLLSNTQTSSSAPPPFVFPKGSLFFVSLFICCLLLTLSSMRTGICI